MKKHTILIISFLLLVFNLQSWGQNSQLFTISGTLLDSVQNKGISYANVGLLNMSDSVFVKGTSTDENGRFTINEVTPGDYLLRTFALNYKSNFLKVSVKNDIDMGTLKLKPLAGNLKEVVVQGEKPVYASEGEKNIYNVTEDPSVQTGTASDALQNAPGVEVDAQGNITLRGVSSVAIWINDKPSHLNAENLKTYIQQMPANSIEKIEVITNPSARYGVKGDGGIINIVTNQKVLKNQFVSFGVKGTSVPSISPWVSYVWSNDKISFNAYVNFDYTNSNSTSKGYSYSFDDNKDTITHAKNNSLNNNKEYGSYLNLNLDYQIDTANMLSFWMGAGPQLTSTSGYSTLYREEYQLDDEIFDYRTLSSSKSKSLWMYGGLNFEHDFKKECHKIQASFDMWHWGQQTAGNDVWLYVSENQPNKFRNTLNNYQSTSYSLDVDYTLPYIKNGEIDLGVSAGYSPQKNISQIDTLQFFETGNVYVNDTLRSKNLTYSESNMDGYVTLQHKFGNFTIKGGLRVSYDIQQGKYEGKPQYNASYPYLEWLPSLHLSYRTKSMHNFSLSYVMRVSTPDFSQLTTYKDYSEEEFSIGNPNLLPTYTHSFDGGWTKYFDRFGSVGISGYYRISTNSISDISDVIYDNFFGRIVSYSKPFNVSTSQRGGAEFRVTYRPKDFMNIRFYANIYDSYFKTHDILHDVDVVSNSFSYSFRLNFWAKMWKKLEIFANASYSSPTISYYSERRPSYSIDCGLRADFFKRKLSVNLTVNDIFNWNKYEYLSTNPYYQSYYLYRSSDWGRSITAGITLRFGKMELESKASTGGAAAPQTGSAPK